MSGSTILDKIIAHKRREVALARVELSPETLRGRLETIHPPRDALAALRRRPGAPSRIIAEIKRASPSKGMLAGGLVAPQLAAEYEEAGASCISVLTDNEFFAGSFADLESVRSVSGLPLLCKEFVIDSWQVLRARTAGADLVLLIAAALSDERLAALLGEIEGLAMTALVEVHTRQELDRALKIGARLIGVNNRNLSTFETSIETSLELVKALPEGVVKVSESGISCRADIESLESAGFDAFLIGEHLVRSERPGDALRELVG